MVIVGIMGRCRKQPWFNHVKFSHVFETRWLLRTWFRNFILRFIFVEMSIFQWLLFYVAQMPLIFSCFKEWEFWLPVFVGKMPGHIILILSWNNAWTLIEVEMYHAKWIQKTIKYDQDYLWRSSHIISVLCSTEHLLTRRQTALWLICLFPPLWRLDLWGAVCKCAGHKCAAHNSVWRGSQI